MVNKILVVDFGSQYNQLIVRRIRDLGVYSELIQPEDVLNKIENTVKGIIFSGGPKSVYEKNKFSIDKKIYSLGIPILGICYGMQLIAHELGGRVVEGDKKEYGKSEVKVLSGEITKGLNENQIVWMSHGDSVSELPNGFACCGSSKNCKNVIIENNELKIYALQFHPEVQHTTNGKTFLKNFIFNICGSQQNWSSSAFINEEINKIKNQVGNDKVICALSGGVDSSVTAALLSKAIGKNLTCLFVDHGLLRKWESESISKIFKNLFNVKFIKINAKKIFLSKLKNVCSPEQKRKIIGKEFIKTFEKQIIKQKEIRWLAQGTLYTDLIESGTKTAKTIKSHHNVGGLPKNMKLKLIEPLNKLFKDEVRQIGLHLGLPKQIVMRQPFPGPGLAIRIIGNITQEKIKLVQESDAILREEIERFDTDKNVWQYFTVLPGIKTVGVKGDKRSYEQVIVIRCVSSCDGMTADYSKLPYDVLDKISNRIVNEIKGINRVVYDITSKPPGTIEWE